MMVWFCIHLTQWIGESDNTQHMVGNYIFIDILFPMVQHLVFTKAQ